MNNLRYSAEEQSVTASDTAEGDDSSTNDEDKE